MPFVKEICGLCLALITIFQLKRIAESYGKGCYVHNTGACVIAELTFLIGLLISVKRTVQKFGQLCFSYLATTTRLHVKQLCAIAKYFKKLCVNSSKSIRADNGSRLFSPHFIG